MALGVGGLHARHVLHLDHAGVHDSLRRAAEDGVQAGMLQLDLQHGAGFEVVLVLLPEAMGGWAGPGDAPRLCLVFVQSVVDLQLHLERPALGAAGLWAVAAEKKHAGVFHAVLLSK